MGRLGRWSLFNIFANATDQCLGLLGILDKRHACTTSCFYSLISHESWLHREGNDSHRFLRVRPVLRRVDIDRKDGLDLLRAFSGPRSFHLWHVRLLPCHRLEVFR
jgi:hypothetical protein